MGRAVELRLTNHNVSLRELIKHLGLFTWREENPGTRKVLEGETTFRLVYMQKFQSVWLPRGEGKQDEIVGL